MVAGGSGDTTTIDSFARDSIRGLGLGVPPLFALFTIRSSSLRLVRTQTNFAQQALFGWNTKNLSLGSKEKTLFIQLFGSKCMQRRENGCHHMSEFQTSHLFATVCPRLLEDRGGGRVRSALKTDGQKIHIQRHVTLHIQISDLPSDTDCQKHKFKFKHGKD